MSEPIEPKNPKPVTRREVLEDSQCARGLFGGREILTTATEPLPDIEETTYRGVLAREEPSTGLPIKHRSLVIGTLTMALISLFTFWIPGFNALLGGTFGGFFARRWSSALGAAALASVLVPALIAFLFGIDKPHFIYLFYGLGFWRWTALNAVCMFIGAAVGVYSRPLADRRGLTREVTA
ncbi:MAG: hypothetical protein ACXU86_02170 [Archangium sp.]